MSKMLKIILIIVILIVLIIAVLGVISFLGSRPMDKQSAVDTMDEMIANQVGKKNVTQAIVYVSSPDYGVDQVFAHGTLAGQPINENTPFHVASVGKAFTATLVGVLIDEGELSLDDYISEYLDAEILSGLFVYEDTDYANQVTVKQLLNHTSGIADYFEDKTTDSEKMQELIVSDPDKIWTPEDLIAFTRDYQSAVSAPNEKYHYSDTGYILLGLIIESVSGKAFHEMLHEHIFTPLEMDNSYLMFYTLPKNEKREIADVHLKDVNIKDYNSLSIDWAGGGIVSTVGDLSQFVRALNNGGIISQKTLDSLYQFDHKFMTGIHYGNGFMEYHFNEYMPTLKMPNYVGHMGVLGTQMFYDKAADTVYICSFGSTDAVSNSVQTMIKILSTLERVNE